MKRLLVDSFWNFAEMAVSDVVDCELYTVCIVHASASVVVFSNDVVVNQQNIVYGRISQRVLDTIDWH